MYDMAGRRRRLVSTISIGYKYVLIPSTLRKLVSMTNTGAESTRPFEAQLVSLSKESIDK